MLSLILLHDSKLGALSGDLLLGVSQQAEPPLPTASPWSSGRGGGREPRGAGARKDRQMGIVMGTGHIALSWDKDQVP